MYFLCGTNCKRSKVSERETPAAPRSPVHTEINRNYSRHKQLPGTKVSLNITLQGLHVFRWAKGGMQVGQVKTIQLFILGSSRMLQEHSHGLTIPFFMYFGHWTHYSSPMGRTPSQTPNLVPAQAATPHTTITHSNYVFNCCALISPQPTITAYSCKPNQGKPAYLHKSCNEKYNDFTNKTWIRTRICDKHFVSRRIENDFLS